MILIVQVGVMFFLLETSANAFLVAFCKKKKDASVVFFFANKIVAIWTAFHLLTTQLVVTEHCRCVLGLHY